MSIQNINMRLVPALIKGYIEIDQPVGLWGDYGIGKTQTVDKIASELKRPIIDIKLSMRSEVDFIGVPFIETLENGQKITKNAIPAFLPQDPNDNSILFLDEINHASHEVMKVAFKLVDERTLGETYKLPVNTRIIFAANQEKYNEFVNVLEPPLINRMAHIFINYDFKDWKHFANEARYSREFIEIIEKYKFVEENKFKEMVMDNIPIKITPRIISRIYNIIGNPNVPLPIKDQMLINEGIEKDVREAMINCINGSFIPFESPEDIILRKINEIELLNSINAAKDLKIEVLEAENKERLTTKMRQENESMKQELFETREKMFEAVHKLEEYKNKINSLI